MNPHGNPSNFRPIRHDRLLQEQVHDSYRIEGKLPEPTVCPQCNAVFHEGHWREMTAPADAHQALCPACHRINDSFPAGYVRLAGKFFQAHKDEILHLVRNREQHERAEHPLKRIMDVQEQGEIVLVTTTDIHLARGIGEALQHAYQGTLEFHYNPEENLLRVHWTH